MGRHKLIILVGMSPAVVTETVFALCQNNDAPDEVIAITTEKGKNEIKNQLIDSGIWKQMLVDLNLSGKIKFGLNSQNIRIIPDHCRENDSCDIVTTDDNNEMADFLLTELRKYTENPEVERISFSIAGGRKSMSAVGALVMTLLGRRNDHLYHVLVNSPYDDPNLKPKFYYPRAGQCHCLQAEEYESTDANLQLGEIPFVKCRYLFEEKLLEIKEYSTLVDNINQDKVKLQIDTSKSTLFINNRPIKLSYLEFVLYWMFAERRKNSLPPLEGVGSLVNGLDEFAKEKGITIKEQGDLGRGNIAEDFIYRSQINSSLSKKASNIKRKLQEQTELSEDDADAVAITSFFRKGKYGLAKSLINADDIEIV